MTDKLIMLVEDNPTDEALTLRALRKHGFANEVVVARDGAEALDILLRTGAHADRVAEFQPALILLDLNLPKIGGLEVLRRLRANERTKMIPVVILTSSDEERDLTEGYALGANSFVGKPVEFGAFADAVHKLGFYWLLLNQPPPAARPAA